MIFTSNKNPALWCEDFEEDATLLCTLDRIFDDATVFKLRGESFRGKKLETISLQTGKISAVEPAVTKEQLTYECWVLGALFVYSTSSKVCRQKLVKYPRQNMVAISRRQHGQICDGSEIDIVPLRKIRFCPFQRIFAWKVVCINE